MHYHLEIIMPPVPRAQVEATVTAILAPFDENGKDEYGEDNLHQFWDFWSIGGRYSGAKIDASVPKERREAFMEELRTRNVTVSGVQFGKQRLEPASQIADVDALWCEWFPDSGIERCPLFEHCGDRLPLDICTLAETPPELTADHVIFAVPKYVSEENPWSGPLRAGEMVQGLIWNGVSWIDTFWDGKVSSAIEWNNSKLEHRATEFRKVSEPGPDWLVVTIDYHS